MRFAKCNNWLAISGVALAIAMAGCAPSAQSGSVPASSALAAADPPNVQDCGIITISTPSKYVCDGKIYTAYQLQHLREKTATAKAGG